MFTAIFEWFERRVEPFPQEDPTRPPSTLVAFIWHYIKPCWPVLATMSSITALISIMEIMLFGFMGSLVDRMTSSTPATFWDMHGTSLIWMSVVLLLLLPLAVVVGSLLIDQSLLGNLPMAIRWQVHRYVLGQSLSYYQDEFAGRIATKIMQSSLAAREVVMKILDVLVYIGVYFISMVVLVGLADIRLALPLVIWLVAYIALLHYYLPRLRKITEKQADARSLMTGQVIDSYTNILTVKLFAQKSRELDYARKGMGAFLDTVNQQMRKITSLFSLLYLLNSLLVFAVGATSIFLWQIDAVSIGAIAVAIGAVLRLNGMSQWIMWETSALFENIGTVEDGINTIAQDQDVADAPNAMKLSNVSGKISFDHVGFHYGKLNDNAEEQKGPGKGVLHDISLQINPGEKIGLVGRSGSGKSTLVNLLLRLYDVESGRITLDGHDISKVMQNSLRQQISMVTQDTSLLHRSVRDNILYGRPNASEEEMRQAAEQAETMAFIPELQDPKGRTGFDAHVGERGIKLSGGQRQRIAIARVLLKNAPILILDEATSALDSEVEAAIQEQLFNLMEGKTVIAIAHRLSTIANLDRLVIMDNGRIVENGTHSELLKSDGIYANLWRRQSGGFLGVEDDIPL